MSARLSIDPTSALSAAVFKEHAELFSAHYGVWGPQGFKPGERIKMSSARLRAQCAFSDACFVAALRSTEGSLIGHAFFTLADAALGKVAWITQLVVHPRARGHGYATRLLGALRFELRGTGCQGVGIASSHPHAIRALMNAIDATSFNLDFMKEHVHDVLSCLGVDYLAPNLVGSAFNEADGTGAIALLDSRFFVDHTEVEQALALEQEWPLGILLEGMEYVAFFPLKTSSRRSSQTSEGSVHSNRSLN